MRKIFYLLCTVCLLFGVLAGCEQMAEEPFESNSGEDVLVEGRGEDAQLNRDNAVGAQTEDVSVNQTSETDEAIDYKIWRRADYIAVAPDDLYRGASVVVVGTFGETVGTYVSSNSLPVTQVKFQIEVVKKGDITPKNIVVEYYGGTVSMESYLATLTEAQITKRGIDLNDENLSKMTVTYAGGETAVVVDRGETYMLFLSYDAENDRYFILSDGYGACKMQNNLVYSACEGKYIATDFG